MERCDRHMRWKIAGAVSGTERVTVVLRMVAETENMSALCLPVVVAVNRVLPGRPFDVARALSAFDQIRLREFLDALRSADIADEHGLPELLERGIRRRLDRILAPPRAPPPKPSKRELHVTVSARRAAANGRAINIGKQLLELRARTKSLREFGKLRSQQFPDVDAQ